MTAAGYGWFVDETPGDDTEYAQGAQAWQLAAVAGSPAAGRLDLLTVLCHELGHMLGLADVPVEDGAARLMTAVLPSGTRRLISDGDIGAAGDLVASGETFREIALGPLSAPVGQLPTLAAAVPTGPLQNGSFGVSDAGDPAFGWQTRGSVTVADGRALMQEEGISQYA